MDPATLLAGLTERQVEAVTTKGAPVCILAGAGSGKTRVLTRRIAYRVACGSAEARHVLALTFTRKAAAELGQRLSALGVRDHVTAGTFHALAYAQLKRWWADHDRRPPALLERKAGLLARLVASGGARVEPADLAGEVEWAKARMISPSHYEAEASRAGRQPPLPAGAMASLYRRYEEEKRHRHLVDFDDLLEQCASTLSGDADFAASQRWRYRHLFVDEFQDVNPAQARLLACWRGDGDDLCVVGDPNQAIYSWNGADPAQLHQFGQREPRATVVHLDDNFRSSPQILAVAGAVLTADGGCGPVLRARRPDGPLPEVRAFETDVDEARGIARAVRDGHRPGGAWSQTAVLARTHAQLVSLEGALRTAGVPYRVRGGEAFLQRPEVKEALAGLGAFGAPLAAGLADLAAALSGQGCEGAEDGGAAGGQDTGGGRRHTYDACASAPSGHPGSPPPGDPTGDRTAVLQEVVRLGQDYLALEVYGSVGGFLAWLRASLRTEAPRAGADAVELATFHAAKGLEWPVVFVAGLERGLVPISHASTVEAVDEERRLLYVAVTRAERELHCSWARHRSFGARRLRRQPSPWLDQIQAARAALATGQSRPGSTEWRAHVDSERRRLNEASTGGHRGGREVATGRHADPDVLDALKAWRAEAARSGGVPAFVVFHDTTLAALAEARPRTDEALLAVPGLGPVKAQRYGAALLAVIAAVEPPGLRRCTLGP